MWLDRFLLQSRPNLRTVTCCSKKNKVNKNINKNKSKYLLRDTVVFTLQGDNGNPAAKRLTQDAIKALGGLKNAKRIIDRREALSCNRSSFSAANRFRKKKKSKEEYAAEKAKREAEDRKNSHDIYQTYYGNLDSNKPPMLLIDGYNVLFAKNKKEMDRLEDNWLVRARLALEEEIIAFSHGLGKRVVIVYDAVQSPNKDVENVEIVQEQNETLEVMFCMKYEADKGISLLCEQFLKEGTPHITVITSDRGLRQMCSDPPRVHCRNSKMFLEDVHRRNKEFDEELKLHNMYRNRNSLAGFLSRKHFSELIQIRQYLSQREATVSPSVVIAYASQTGTSQDIAQSINAECNQQSIKSRVLSLNDLRLDGVSASKSPVVICVVSSTGDGEAPDNSQTFFKDMKQARMDNPGQLFKGVHYTCLGLGDSNYTSFMFMPRLLKKGFEELGAELFYDYKEADEVEGLDELADEWIEGLWEPLKSTLASLNNKNEKTRTLEKRDLKPDRSLVLRFDDVSNKLSDFNLSPDLDLQGVPAMPVCAIEVKLEEANLSDECPNFDKNRTPATLVSVHKLTAEWSDREVYSLVFDLGPANELAFKTGDSLDLMPQNNPVLVEDLLRRLELNGDLKVSISVSEGLDKTLPHIKAHYTIRDCFLYGLELCAPPKKTLLRFLAEHCEASDEKYKIKFLVSKMGREAYHKFIISAKISLLDILLHFTSCHPPLAGLLELLPPLAPRMYSIANSPKINSKRIKIAYSVAKFQTPYGPRTGVATSWLKTLSQSALNQDKTNPKLPTVGVCIRSGGVFCCPTDLSKPWILIGPGTGVSPFVGFLQERAELMKDWNGPLGPCWLFYGCRRDDEDFLFKTELQSLKDEGILTNFYTAFSRQTDEKIYVQHKMKLYSAELYHDVYELNGYVFVCGDGTQMAQDVHKCLGEILIQEGKMTQEQSTNWLNQKLQDHTYVRDIWS
eukprot:g1556.t1